MGLALAALVAGFAIGSVPFGFLLVRLLGRGDIRSVGSGNIGATNVGRLLGPAGWALTLAADAGKGAAGVWLGSVLAVGVPSVAVAGGVGAVLGHCYTPWLRGRGGKGVATMLGAFGVLSPVATGISVVAFALVAGCYRTVSLASLSAAALLPIVVFARGEPAAVVIGAALVAVVVGLRHRGNIARLRAGNEAQVGRGES
ncbi:MAG TPA: glycerol-3-phosphate acyltransferase [Acidobacteriota bacterium]|nr:glycerol-3-phosphate acyltransferase [Acidobacteriota bacterium]